MPVLDLSIDEVLTTTRAVRKRLDLRRPMEADVIRECLELAVQAPNPGNQQNRHFVVVTDPSRRAALAALYRKGAHATGQEEDLQRAIAAAGNAKEAAALTRMAESARHLTERLHEVPVHVVPCVQPRAEGLSTVEQAALCWGAILPATWSLTPRHDILDSWVQSALAARDVARVMRTLRVEFAGQDDPVGRALTEIFDRLVVDCAGRIAAGRQSGAIPPGPPPGRWRSPISAPLRGS